MPDIQDQFGNKVKVACAPCIRGHRSSQCNEKHYDRIMVAVRKPGRPLTACPHSKGQRCTCSSAQVTYTIPRATAKCASGAIQAIAVSANEPLTINPHASSNSRLKRMHQHRTSKSGASTPLSKAEDGLKTDYFESDATNESPLEQTPQPALGGCCGGRAIVEEDESNSPTSPPSSSNAGMSNHQSTSTRDYEDAGPMISPFKPQDSDHHSNLPSSSSHTADKSNQRSHLVHDPANNGLEANGFQHGCDCGPDCACLGCAAHPQNSTTIQYVKELYDYQADEADESMDSFTMSPVPSNNAFGLDPTLSTYQNDPNLLPADLYFPYQLDLPSCDTGGCRCDTNCTCTGCLTHSGHNGIATRIQNPIQFDPFSIDTSHPPHMTTPGASLNTFENACSPVAPCQCTFSIPTLGFHDPVIPQPPPRRGSNFMANVNPLTTPSNHGSQHFYSSHPPQMQLNNSPNPLGIQLGQQHRRQYQPTSARFPPLTHAHPTVQYGVPPHSLSQSPIATPTSAGPSQASHGF